MIRWFYTTQFVLLLSHAPFYSFYSNLLYEAGYLSWQIGALWSLGVVAEIAMFRYGAPLLNQSYRAIWLLVIGATALRWLITGGLTQVWQAQVAAQFMHAISFGLFQMTSMKFITESFSFDFQSRAQAAYASFWGLGVALGSIIAGLYWDRTGGGLWFIISAVMLLCYLVALSFSVRLRQA